MSRKEVSAFVLGTAILTLTGCCSSLPKRSGPPASTSTLTFVVDGFVKAEGIT